MIWTSAPTSAHPPCGHIWPHNWSTIKLQSVTGGHPKKYDAWKLVHPADPSHHGAWRPDVPSSHPLHLHGAQAGVALLLALFADAVESRLECKCALHPGAQLDCEHNQECRLRFWCRLPLNTAWHTDTANMSRGAK